MLIENFKEDLEKSVNRLQSDIDKKSNKVELQNMKVKINARIDNCDDVSRRIKNSVEDNFKIQKKVNEKIDSDLNLKATKKEVSNILTSLTQFAK